MPAYIHIEEVVVDLADVADEEDAEYAAALAPSEGEDLHTVLTLREALERLGRAVPGAAVFVVYTTEWDTRDAMVLRADGVKDAEPSEIPPARPAPVRTCSSAYATYARAKREAWEAIHADDGAALLRLLDDPGLGEQRDERHPGMRAKSVESLRATIWRRLEAALERKHGDTLTFERLKRALEEETDMVVEALAYRLFPFEHLAQPIADAFDAAPAGQLRTRLETIIKAWPDFPRLPAALVPRPAPARATATKAERLERQLDAVLPSLKLPKLHGFRKLLRELDDYLPDDVLDEVRAHVAPELVALAHSSEPPRVRAFAIEILLALRIKAEELEPFLEGLPETSVLRAIRDGVEHRSRVSIERVTSLRRDGLSYHVEDRTLLVSDDEGNTLQTHSIPFAPTISLLDRGKDGVLAWDGRSVFGQPIESGLWIKPDGSAEELLPPMLLCEVPAPAPGPAASPPPSRLQARSVDPREVEVHGVLWDASALAKPAERALLEAELRRLVDFRGSFVTWLGVLAKTFRKAHVEIAVVERYAMTRRHYVLACGDWQWEPPLTTQTSRTRGTPSAGCSGWETLVATDMRNDPEMQAPSEEHAAFSLARAAFARALDARAEAADLLRRLLSPALRPAQGTLKRLAADYRTLAHEAVAALGDPAPIDALREVLRDEPDEEVIRRLTQAWSEAARQERALAARYREEASPVLRARLRALLGYQADEVDRSSALARALDRARSERSATARGAASGDLGPALQAALAAEPLAEPPNQPRRKTKAEKAVLDEVAVLVEEACRSNDPGRLLAELERPALRELPRAYELRARLWGALLERARPTLTLDRVLLALQIEPSHVADIIGYKLYLQGHLAPGMGAALGLALELSPRPKRLIRRLAYALSEWPDHPSHAVLHDLDLGAE